MVFVDEILVPLIIFGSIVAVVFIIARYRTERLRIEGSAGEDYRRLADQAIAHQKTLAEEVQRMNVHLREIEKLLREV